MATIFVRLRASIRARPLKSALDEIFKDSEALLVVHCFVFSASSSGSHVRHLELRHERVQLILSNLFETAG